MLLLSMVVLITAFLGNMASGVNPNNNPFYIYVAITLPFILLISLLLLIFWTIKRSWCFIIPLIALFVNYQFITSMFGIGRAFCNAPSSESFKLKIATYNVHSFNYNPEHIPVNYIAEYMQSKGIGVLCMQEYSHPPIYNDEEVQMAFLFLKYRHIRESSLSDIGMAIYSKYPIIDEGKIEFTHTANGAIWIDIELPDKKIVRVINVHLQTTGINKGYKLGIIGTASSLSYNAKIRALQAQMIRDFIKNTKYAVILAGDFNDTPSSYTYKTVRGDLDDAFKVGGFGIATTYKSYLSLLRIDYILNSKDFKCYKYYSFSSKWSDHFPVIAEFEMIGDDQ